MSTGITYPKTVVTKISLERLELSNKPTVVITERIKKQIDWLHKKCGSTEWSGELITSETNTINDLDNWTIKCEDIYLVDVGSPGYTAYEVDKGGFKSADIIDLYEAYPGLMDGTQKNQHIHSHHNMAAFFSGTDWSQLEDRGILSNYFLMLIVNFKGEYVAKVAFKANKSGRDAIKLEFANNQDGFAPLELKGDTAKDILVVMDCKIVFESVETDVDTAFSTRYDNVKAAILADRPIYTGYYNQNTGGFNTPVVGAGGYKSNGIGYKRGGVDYSEKKWEQGELGLDSDIGMMDFTDRGDFIDTLPENTKQKSFLEMTEKEWQEHVNSESASFITREDAFGLINTYLTGSNVMQTVSPISNVIAKNKELKTKYDMSEYCMEFAVDFDKHYMKYYPNGTIEDYITILEHLIQEFTSIRYNRLAKEILEQLEWMHEEEVNDLVSGFVKK